MAQDIAATKAGLAPRLARRGSDHRTRSATPPARALIGTVMTAEKLKKAEEVGHFEVTTP